MTDTGSTPITVVSAQTSVTVQLTPDTQIVVQTSGVGPQGLQGNQGIQGPPGEVYDFTQEQPATVWYINHNLLSRPVVAAWDSSGASIEGDISYTDLNNLTITWSAGTSGGATCG
jgi:hypothetical protein